MERDSRIKEYYIQYSDDGLSWKDYTYEGQRKARICLIWVWWAIYFVITILIIFKNLPFVLYEKSFFRGRMGHVRVKIILILT